MTNARESAWQESRLVVGASSGSSLHGFAY
jgi:hypothetical protein